MPDAIKHSTVLIMFQAAQHMLIKAFNPVAVLLLIASFNTLAKESEGIRRQYPPLFPIQLKTAFPQPAEAFQEMLGLVRDHYYSDVITEQALYYAAIEGILRFVSPPQLKERRNIWSEDEFKRILESLTGMQSTVGIKSNFDPLDGALTVREVSPGSPAQSLLRPHDRIMRINGESLKAKSAQEIDSLLRGKPGDTVRFKVVRDIHILDVEIQLEAFRSHPLKMVLLPDSIAYLALQQMTENSAKEFAVQIKALQDKGIRRLILDLRGNGGGIFTEALKMAELFLPARQQVVHTLKHGGEIKSFVSGNSTPLSLHLVVLVNHKTASAAEILAAALQGNRRAQIVGAATFGKATLEQTFKLTNGYRARFIIGALYGPGGRSWHGEGIRPDLVVNASVKNKNTATQPLHKQLARDPQLLAAWRLLH